MTRSNCLKLALLPFFALLAVGSSSPKKSNGTKPDDTATGTTTTTAGSPRKVLGHCMQKTGGSCTESYVFGLGGEASEKKICEQTNGIYETGTACPSKDTLLGVCAQNEFQISPDDKPALREKLFYYDEGVNKNVGGAMGKDACSALSGVWSDGPAFAKKPAAKAAAPAAKPAPAAKKK